MNNGRIIDIESISMGRIHQIMQSITGAEKIFMKMIQINPVDITA